jgi:catechol 2,3-dioxygenase-like lactoylglutathione lyase family enzyme
MPTHPKDDSVTQLRVVVTVDDFDAALTVYREALGLEEQVAFQGLDGARVAILHAGRATLEIANRPQSEMIDRIEVGHPTPEGIRLAFEVADTSAAASRLVDAGATLAGGPVITPWRSLNARVAAPDGTQLTMFQELDPLSQRSSTDGFGTSDR